MSSPIYLVASGDLRLSASLRCWAAQAAVESLVRGIAVRFSSNREFKTDQLEVFEG